MTFNTGTGFTDITTDSGTAVITAAKPNASIVGSGGITTSAAGSAITISGSVTPMEGFTNIGFDYSSPTFSITSRDGTALSGSNVATITFNSSSSPGTLVTVNVTANQSFEDSSGTSDIVDNLFGLLTGETWGTNDIPFFVYAVLNDDEDAVSFMISRMPWMPKSPSSTEIGTPASAIADEQYSFFAFDSITVTEWDENPVVYIGCFRMRFTQPGAADDWTVQALSLEDGPSKNVDNTFFTFPQAVMGALANSYYLASGGTAPIFNNGFYRYRITRTGTVDILYEEQDLTNSATGTNLELSVPYTYGTSFGDPAIGTGWVKDGSGAPAWFIFGHPVNGTKYSAIMAWNATTLDSDASAAVLFTGTGATRLIYLNMAYRVNTNFND